MATQLDLAAAQFVGFHHGRWYRDDVIGLVEGMGLTKKEWLKLKDENTIDNDLTEFQLKEIDEYFKI